MSTKIALPNGCSCSQLSVHPTNWKTKSASLKEDWYINYRFYDPEFPKPKQRSIRGMNEFKTLHERQTATQKLLENEMHLLQIECYNPIKNLFMPFIPDNDYLIHPEMPFSEALQKAFELFEGESKTDMKSSLKYLQLSIKNMDYHNWPVKDIRRRHLIRILENCEKIKKREGKIWSSNQFNHYRKALLILYKIFVKYETVEANPVKDIEKKQYAAAPRQILTEEQRQLIDNRLKINNYRFWNFIHLFFHSGARLTEMSRVQGKHVDLENQYVNYLVKKGKDWSWIMRPITDEALPFWQRAMINCSPEQYVFSKGLLPGNKLINSAQYTRRWRVWVKKPIIDEDKKYSPKAHERINWMKVDLYELKHTHTTMIMDALDGNIDNPETIAAAMNGHTTDAMVKKVYDIKNKLRKDEKIKRLPIKFV